jgi:4-hydroxy-tetrahydrodipicolinate synthase
MLRGSIAALITPFQRDGSLDLQSFCRLIEWHLEQGTDGIVCFGTTGEVPTLTHEEKQLLLKTCVDVVGKKIPVIANTGTNDTKSSVMLTRMAKECGADACLAIVPYYNRPSQEGCIRHFQKIAEIGLDCIVYHHPKRTGVVLNFETVGRLLKIPFITGIKDASENLQLAEQFSSCSFFSGVDELSLDILERGGAGAISVIANLLPKKHSEMLGMALENNFEAAKKIHAEFKGLYQALSVETNPQPIKYALSLLKKCLPVWRLPLIEPSVETKNQIEKEMKKLKLLSSPFLEAFP